MAIAVQHDFKGATLDQYDQVIQKLGFTRGGKANPGCMFHWVTKTSEGIRVTDVWSDRETFEKFAQEKVGPTTQAVGVPGPPETTVFEVHNFLTAG